MNENRGDRRENKAACRGQGALEKGGSISLTPRFSGVASGSRSFLTVSTVFPAFAGPFGTFLGAPCAQAVLRSSLFPLQSSFSWFVLLAFISADERFRSPPSE